MSNPASPWTLTEVVSDSSWGSSPRPVTVVDGEGTVHVAWYDFSEGIGPSDPCILYRCKPKDGPWGDLELVSAESDHQAAYPAIAVSAAGTVHMVWWDSSDYSGSGTDADIFYKYKPRDGAWSLTEVVTLDGGANNRETLPAVIADANDRVHVVWAEIVNFIDFNYHYKQRDPSGAWLPSEPVFVEERLNSFGAVLALDDQGTVHMAWDIQIDSHGTSTWEILYRARDGAGNWSDLEVVSTESDSAKGSPSLAVDALGTLHIVWIDHTDLNGCGIDKDLFYKTRPRGGDWTMTEVISLESDESLYGPELEIGADQTVHLAWFEDSLTPANKHIFYRYRTGTCDWSVVEKVSTESGIHIDTEDPSMALEADGTVHLVWEDETDFGGAGSDADVFYKRKNCRLWADAFELPVQTGGVIVFRLNAGPDHAYRSYLLLGGVSGIAPGLSLPGGTAVLPLNWDPLTEATLLLVNIAPFHDFHGLLDGDGRATAILDLPGPVSCGYTGPVFFAYALYNPWNLASNPLVIEFVDQ